jgi:hypothetical protein
MLYLLTVGYAQFVTKVKYSSLCTGQLQVGDVSRRLRLPDFQTFVHKCGQVLSPTSCPPVTIHGTHFFRGQSWPQGHLRHGGLCERKILMIRSGTEPTTALSHCDTVSSKIHNRTKYKAMSGTKVFVYQDHHKLLGVNLAKYCAFQYLTFLLVWK